MRGSSMKKERLLDYLDEEENGEKRAKASESSGDSKVGASYNGLARSEG